MLVMGVQISTITQDLLIKLDTLGKFEFKLQCKERTTCGRVTDSWVRDMSRIEECVNEINLFDANYQNTEMSK